MKARFVLSAAVAALIATGAQPAVADGDTLRIAHYDNPASRGTPYGTYGAHAAIPMMAFLDSMTYVDVNGNVGPGLALSWEATSDTTWIFKLRPGVKS